MRRKENYRFLRVAEQLNTNVMAGIATINSGTAQVTVTAAAADSGAVVLTQPIQMPNAQSSLNPLHGITVPISVANGSFVITTVGSHGVIQPTPVAWAVFRTQ